MFPNVVTGAVMKVPFVEIVTTLLNKKLPLTEHDYDEFMDPFSSPKTLSYMLSYDPYVNLTKGDHFPHLLVTASEQDSRVPFYIPIKYIHRMRSLCTKKDARLVLSIGEFGHFGDG